MNITNNGYPPIPQPCGQPQNFQQPMVNYSTPVPQPQQRSMLLGKYVNNVNEIFPNEVPMDGSRAYFPSVDEKNITVKYWGSNGLIETKTYKLEDTINVSNNQNDIMSIINKRFDKLEKSLNLKNNYQKKTDRKEVSKNAEPR